MPQTTPPEHARSRPAGATDSHTCHAEDGHLEPSVEFDYDSIDRNVFHTEQDDKRPMCDVGDTDNVEDSKAFKDFTDLEIDAACKVFTRLVEWIWQDGMKNVEGLQIRASIVCWIFLSQLRPLTLTEMAKGFGKKKQSLGRWVDDFKRAFPRIRICHMKGLGR